MNDIENTPNNRDTSPSHIIGLKIRKLRNKKGLTGKELGQHLQLSQQHVSRIENGTTRLNVEQLQLISNVLEIELNDLLVGVGYDVKQLYSPFICETNYQANSIILL